MTEPTRRAEAARSPIDNAIIAWRLTCERGHTFTVNTDVDHVRVFELHARATHDDDETIRLVNHLTAILE